MAPSDDQYIFSGRNWCLWPRRIHPQPEELLLLVIMLEMELKPISPGDRSGYIINPWYKYGVNLSPPPITVKAAASLWRLLLLVRMLIVPSSWTSLCGPSPQSLRESLSDWTLIKSCSVGGRAVYKMCHLPIFTITFFCFATRCQHKRKHLKFLILWGNCFHLLKAKGAVEIISDQ